MSYVKKREFQSLNMPEGHVNRDKASVIISLLCLAACLNAMGCAGQISRNERRFYADNTKAYLYTDAAGRTMAYRLFVPRNHDPGKQYPLILSLHGAGSRGRDNLKQLRPWVAGWLDEAVQKAHPCIILMPQCPSRKQWVGTPWGRGSYSLARVPISDPMTLAKAILDRVVKEAPVDRSRIYVMGASMGGYGAWDFAMRYPELIAAAVPICGAGDPAMGAAIKHVPIWAFHGGRDNVVPPSGSQDMIDAIQRAGGTRARLTMYPTVKHDAYARAWKEQALIDWVFEQKRSDHEPDTAGSQ
jgi:predicted peptidase